MLDRKFILENVELVKQNCADRGVVANVDQLVALELRRREKQREVEDFNRRANEVAKSIGKAAEPETREARKEEGRQLREQKDRAKAKSMRWTRRSRRLQAGIPNMSHPDAPIGATIRRTWNCGAASWCRGSSTFPSWTMSNSRRNWT